MRSALRVYVATIDMGQLRIRTLFSLSLLAQRKEKYCGYQDETEKERRFIDLALSDIESLKL